MFELNQQHVDAMATDAYAPAVVEARVENAAVTKANLATGRCFVLAMFAGAFIGMGAAFFCLLLGDTTLPFAAQRILGGLCFCLGLVLVLCCGAELFTGNSLMVCGLLSKKITVGGLVKNWVVVWLGNFVGALIIMALLFFSNLQGMNAGAVGDVFVSVAAGKVVLDPGTLFAKGILCNVFVCLAVWIGFAARSVADKVVGILLPIAAFVAMGFEHCVANMFFLSMGYACKLAGFGAAVATIDSLTLGGIGYNLLLATIGNIVGGAVFVGLGYWVAYHKRAS